MLGYRQQKKGGGIQMLNSFFGKYGKQIAQCALIVGIISSQGTCKLIIHQPELPESMKQLLEQQK